MSQHSISILWTRNNQDFIYEKYSRNHIIKFGDNSTICASSSPEYFGDPKCLNPEQAFILSLCSCHMLTFLAIACKRGYIVNKYTDNAYGELGKNTAGKTAIVKIQLNPEVTFEKNHSPSNEKFLELHEQAHKACFIANSLANCVKVNLEPKIILAE